MSRCGCRFALRRDGRPGSPCRPPPALPRPRGAHNHPHEPLCHDHAAPNGPASRPGHPAHRCCPQPASDSNVGPVRLCWSLRACSKFRGCPSRGYGSACRLRASRGMPLAVLVPGCDESATAYTDATQSSARNGMLSKQNKSAAIKRRMRDPRFSWLDAPRGELKIRGVAAECCCKTAIIADQTCSGSVGSENSFHLELARWRGRRRSARKSLNNVVVIALERTYRPEDAYVS